MDGALIIDSDGVVVDVNEAYAQMSGYSREELRGKSIADLDAEEMEQHVRRIIEHGRGRFETRHRRKDGTHFEVEVSARAHPSKCCLFVFLRDVTVRRKMEDDFRMALRDAERAARAKSDFLNLMGYELRTPLSTVLGFADLLSITKLDDVQTGYLDSIRDGSQRLLGILNDILDYTALEKGRLEVDNAPLAVADLVESCQSRFLAAAAEKSLDFKIRVVPGLPGVIHGDGRRIIQILGNLLNNAIKFTENGGVALHIRPADLNGAAAIEFAVADTGIGIPADVMKGLFEPFTQADSSITRRFGGAGLGLTLGRGLAEAMGGKISVVSEVGRGSTFVLVLPLQENGVSAAVADVRGKAASGAVTTKPVLVVEDDKASALVARKMLAKLGYTVEHCATGEAAVQEFVSGKFAVILMDLRMPVMDGLEATRRIREIEPMSSTGSTPIIALTANVMPEDRRRCLDAGMDDFLPKPVKLDDLRNILARWIRGA